MSNVSNTLKQRIVNLLAQALEQYAASFTDEDVSQQIKDLSPHIERARDTKFGDFASNAAMMLTKIAKQKPRDIAESIIAAFPENELIQESSIAGPGFINFRLKPEIFQQELQQVLNQASQYGCQASKGQKVLVEYVSANPTGPLHVGHGRHAAYGASVCNLLKTAGYQVHGEYYVNDAGRQMQILATSTWIRYLALSGIELTFPVNGYQGDYIIEIARLLKEKHSDKFVFDSDKIFSDLPDDEKIVGGVKTGDKDKYIDALALRTKELIGEDGFQIVLDAALDSILSDIKDDLHEFGVVHDEWFSERRLVDDGLIKHALDKLEANGTVYEKDGAKWFKATDFGDDKDRVVVRENGVTTYFASDIAYHLYKRERGNHLLLDILGSDHHGYIARVKAGLEAMGEPPESLEVRLMQFAVLYRGKEKVAMTTRGGDFVSLRELRNEVGNDAARLFYVMRSNEQHLDFDLELAKKRDNENPVYYLQYAHARICRVFKTLTEKDYVYDESAGAENLHLVDSDSAYKLISFMSRYPEIIELSAANRAPHTLVQYLRDLSAEFHSFYNSDKVIVENDNLRNARLYLLKAVQQVLQNGFAIIGISAPEQM